MNSRILGVCVLLAIPGPLIDQGPLAAQDGNRLTCSEQLISMLELEPESPRVNVVQDNGSLVVSGTGFIEGTKEEISALLQDLESFSTWKSTVDEIVSVNWITDNKAELEYRVKKCGKLTTYLQERQYFPASSGLGFETLEGTPKLRGSYCLIDLGEGQVILHVRCSAPIGFWKKVGYKVLCGGNAERELREWMRKDFEDIQRELNRRARIPDPTADDGRRDVAEESSQSVRLPEWVETIPKPLPATGEWR